MSEEIKDKKEETKKEKMPEDNKNVKNVTIDKDKLSELIEQNKKLADRIEKMEERKDNSPYAKTVKDHKVSIKLYEGKYVIGITPEMGCKKIIRDKGNREHLIVDLLLMDKEGNESTAKDVSLNDLVASNKMEKVEVINFYKKIDVKNDGKIEKVSYSDWSSKYTGQDVENIVITEIITTEVKLPNGKVLELKSNVINL